MKTHRDCLARNDISRAQSCWHKRKRQTEAYGFIEFEISNSTISTVFRQPLRSGWPWPSGCPTGPDMSYFAEEPFRIRADANPRGSSTRAQIFGRASGTVLMKIGRMPLASSPRPINRMGLILLVRLQI